MGSEPVQLLVPKQKLVLTDAIVIIVGIVIGAGIFRTPSLVAANTNSDTVFFWHGYQVA